MYEPIKNETKVILFAIIKQIINQIKKGKVALHYS